MKADIEWIEKIDGGIKRKTRITFLSHGNIKWQFKRSDQESWDYDTPPASSDWSILLQKAEALYNRRRIPFKHLECIRALKKKADRD